MFCLKDVIFYVKQLWKIEEIEENFEGWGQGNYFGGNCKNVINTCIERLTLVCTLTLYLAYCIMLFDSKRIWLIKNKCSPMLKILIFSGYLKLSYFCKNADFSFFTLRNIKPIAVAYWIFDAEYDVMSIHTTDERGNIMPNEVF